MQNNKLVVYFSAEGTTAGVAKVIAGELNAPLCQIVPAAPYTAADLNWMDKHSRSSVEMADPDFRPAMANAIDVDGYDVIFLGFPIWWYVEPRIVDSFIKSCNLSGKTVVVFATSGGSGAERSVARLKTLCPAAVWKGGDCLSRGSAAAWARQFK